MNVYDNLSSEESLQSISNDSSDLQEVVDNSNEFVNAEEQTPTQIEVVQNSTDDESGEVSTTSLDIGSLNEFFASEEELRASQISVGQNDYFDFIPQTIQDYFAGIMDKYPLNEYYAYHQRHWLQNSQYHSYYDDYYYLFPDIKNNPTECYEVIKYNGQSNYVVNHTTATRAQATIEYGSAVGQSDFRKGVSTLESKALLFTCALLVCYVVLHNLFAHFAHH